MQTVRRKVVYDAIFLIREFMPCATAAPTAAQGVCKRDGLIRSKAVLRAAGGKKLRPCWVRQRDGRLAYKPSGKTYLYLGRRLRNAKNGKS